MFNWKHNKQYNLNEIIEEEKYKEVYLDRILLIFGPYRSNNQSKKN